MAKQSRGAILTLRISEQEQDELRRAAEQRGLSVSEYVRTVVRNGGVMTAGADTHIGESFSSTGPGSSQRGGQDLQIHGASWTVTGPGQEATGHTMTVLANE